MRKADVDGARWSFERDSWVRERLSDVIDGDLKICVVRICVDWRVVLWSREQQDAFRCGLRGSRRPHHSPWALIRASFPAASAVMLGLLALALGCKPKARVAARQRHRGDTVA